MNRLFVIVLLALGFVPSLSQAVDIKNIRPCHGPLGALRSDPSGTIRLLPGDLFFMNYDIEGLTFDAKTGKASYETILELLDGQGKVLFEKKTPNDVVPQLGGTRMPGDLHVIMSTKQAPGKYSVRLTVHDKIAKDAKRFKYDFEVVPEAFGIIGTAAPALGLPGQHHMTLFHLVNMTLDGKKQPNVEVLIRILDDKGKAVAEPVKMMLPRDLPENSDLEKVNLVPLSYPVFLNRPGRFTVEVLATDKNGKKSAELRFPLTVVDLSTIGSK